jgi:hypothetical protein
VQAAALVGDDVAAGARSSLVAPLDAHRPPLLWVDRRAGGQASGASALLVLVFAQLPGVRQSNVAMLSSCGGI